MTIPNTSPSPVPPQRPPRPKKHLGQHFLINAGVLRQIAGAADLSEQDVVIEVGPGRGALTRELLRHAGSVIAVEVDRDLCARLREELGADPRFRVVEGDILRQEPEELLSLAPGGGAGEYKLTGNLPYYITAPVLRHFLAGPRPPVLSVVMVQWEVAQSILGGPGNASLLGVAVQFYGRPRLVTAVSPGSFSPPPKVRSAVLRIDTHPGPPVDVPSAEEFFQAVRAGFSARRKQLRNALANGWRVPPEQAAAVLRKAGVPPDVRPERLGLEAWARIAWARRRVV